jgi:ribose transport system ATP-binding protein
VKVLEATGIRKCFGGVVALSNGNFSCREGRITGLLGANGSGKSTISKIIAGVYRADAGEVKYRDRTVQYRNPNEARKDGIAMVFQNLSLVPDLKVWQNIVLGAEEARGPFLDDRQAMRVSQELIDQLLPGLDIRKTVRELGPGEMQIVEIAKAISADPKLLILDEPTAALEKAEVKSLFRFMRGLAERGVAINFTSHRLWEVMEICDDVIIFRNGEDVASINFEADGRDPARIVSCISGDAQRASSAKPASPSSSEAALKVEGLRYGDSLKDLSFELRKGEILGVGGLAGQGQHELLLALAGSYPSVECRADVGGRKVRLNRPANAIRNSILLVPGDRELEGLFMKHSVFTNMIFPKLGLARQPVFTPRKKYRRECEAAIDLLSIKAHSLDMPVRALSGGNQQKIVVGRWLSFDARVLLLADPAKGVDVGAKRDLYGYIEDQVREKGASVLLYASDIEELVDHCSRVLVMYEGRIVATLEGDEVNEERIVSASMRVGRKDDDEKQR